MPLPSKLLYSHQCQPVAPKAKASETGSVSRSDMLIIRGSKMQESLMNSHSPVDKGKLRKALEGLKTHGMWWSNQVPGTWLHFGCF